MSMTMTETVTITEEKNQADTKKPTTLRLGNTSLFKTSTSPGNPWPNPPKGSVTSYEDDKGKNQKKNSNPFCCLPSRRK